MVNSVRYIYTHRHIHTHTQALTDTYTYTHKYIHSLPLLILQNELIKLKKCYKDVTIFKFKMNIFVYVKTNKNKK